MILELISQSIREYRALEATQVLVVAVSGGCDSVALLHILQVLEPRLKVKLHVASLDHGIRGEAGQRDLAFVGELAERWRIPYTLGRADVPQLAREQGLGMEAAARRARYDFLARVAGEVGSNCVAVGHHAQDQAETILMHMIRGSGTRGLQGMRIVSPLPHHAGIRLIRPLLAVTRAQLESYCEENKLSFRQDDSNEDRSYRRNYVRHEIMPRLQQLNPDALGAFARLAESAAADEDFLRRQFDIVVLPLIDVASDNWRISKEAYSRLHPAMRRRFLRQAFAQLAGDSESLPHRLTVEIATWLQKAQVSGRRHLGAGLQLRVGYNHIYVEREDSVVDASGFRLLPGGADISIDAAMPLTMGDISVRLASEAVACDGGASLKVPADLALRLRTRRPGDRFKPKGMGGNSRKLKDWMIDRKIPRELRDRIPLVSADAAIIAICLGETWHLADLSQFEAGEQAQVTLLLT